MDSLNAFLEGLFLFGTVSLKGSASDPRTPGGNPALLEWGSPLVGPHPPERRVSGAGRSALSFAFPLATRKSLPNWAQKKRSPTARPRGHPAENSASARGPRLGRPRRQLYGFFNLLVSGQCKTAPTKDPGGRPLRSPPPRNAGFSGPRWWQFHFLLTAHPKNTVRMNPRAGSSWGGRGVRGPGEPGEGTSPPSKNHGHYGKKVHEKPRVGRSRAARRGPRAPSGRRRGRRVCA